MTREHFENGIQRLLSVFCPYEWDAQAATEYRRITHKWSKMDWDETVTRLIDGEQRSGSMPMPSRVKAVYAEVVSGRKVKKRIFHPARYVYPARYITGMRTAKSTMPRVRVLLVMS